MEQDAASLMKGAGVFAVLFLMDRLFRIASDLLKARKAAISEFVDSKELAASQGKAIDEKLHLFCESVRLRDMIDARADHRVSSMEMVSSGRHEALVAQIHSMREQDATWKLQHTEMHAEQTVVMRSLEEAVTNLRITIAHMGKNDA